MVIDLDQFKEANDRHGHDVGDSLLCGLAARFAAVVPESALLARTGGDEFVVIAPGLDEHAVKALADQIVAAASRALRSRRPPVLRRRKRRHRCGAAGWRSTS